MPTLDWIGKAVWLLEDREPCTRPQTLNKIEPLK